MADENSKQPSSQEPNEVKFSHKSRDKAAKRKENKYTSISPKELNHMKNPDELING